jgi:hypothetical protein
MPVAWDSLLLVPVEGVFGQPATWTNRAGNTSALLNGVFDEAVRDVEVVDGIPVTSTRPCYGVRVAELPVLPKQGDTLLVLAGDPAPATDTTYVIREVRVDGHGWVLLLLNHQQ